MSVARVARHDSQHPGEQLDPRGRQPPETCWLEAELTRRLERAPAGLPRGPGAAAARNRRQPGLASAPTASAAATGCPAAVPHFAAAAAPYDAAGEPLGPARAQGALGEPAHCCVQNCLNPPETAAARALLRQNALAGARRGARGRWATLPWRGLLCATAEDTEGEAGMLMHRGRLGRAQGLARPRWELLTCSEGYIEASVGVAPLQGLVDDPTVDILNSLAERSSVPPASRACEEKWNGAASDLSDAKLSNGTGAADFLAADIITQLSI